MKNTMTLILGLTILIAGCTGIEPKIAQAKLSEFKIGFNKKSFFKCIKNGDTDKIELFLDGGMEANLLDINEFTPLICAIESNQPKIVELLINNGSDVNLKLEAFWGRTDSELMFRPTAPFHLVWLKDKPMIAKTAGWTPLMHATAIKNIKAVELLLTHQADVNIRNYAGESALLLSIGKNREITDLLLKNGSDINAYSEDVHVRMTRTPIMTPLSIAASLKDFALVNYLLKKGANPNDGVSLLWIIGRDNIEMLKYFLKKGADPNKANPRTGALPLTSAATSGTLKELKLLVEHGANVNLKESGKFNATALMWAAYQGRKDSVAFLIRNGANVNVKCKETIEGKRIMGPGENALFAAVKGAHGDIVELLLQEGAVDSYKADNGDTILALAEKGLKEATEEYKTSSKSTREQNAWIEKKYKDYIKIVRLLNETKNQKREKHINGASLEQNSAPRKSGE